MRQLSINKEKYIRSLHLAKHRQKYQNFIVEGSKAASDVLANRADAVAMVVATRQWIEAHSDLLTSCSEIFEVDEPTLRRVSLLTTPNEVLLVVRVFDSAFNVEIAANDLTLYLDGLQDPGNVGTIIRIADWFAVRHIIFGMGTVEVYNPKVIQASMGSFLRVSCIEMDINDLMEKSGNIPVFGTVPGSANFFETTLPKPAIIVVGNESKGLSARTKAVVTQSIAIPKPLGGGAESLNVAVATGIFLSAWRFGC